MPIGNYVKETILFKNNALDISKGEVFMCAQPNMLTSSEVKKIRNSRSGIYAR